MNNLLTFPQLKSDPINMFTDLPIDYIPVEVTIYQPEYRQNFDNLDLFEMKQRIKYLLDEIEMLGELPPKNPFNPYSKK